LKVQRAAAGARPKISTPAHHDAAPHIRRVRMRQCRPIRLSDKTRTLCHGWCKARYMVTLSSGTRKIRLVTEPPRQRCFNSGFVNRIVMQAKPIKLVTLTLQRGRGRSEAKNKVGHSMYHSRVGRDTCKKV